MNKFGHYLGQTHPLPQVVLTSSKHDARAGGPVIEIGVAHNHAWMRSVPPAVAGGSVIVFGVTLSFDRGDAALREAGLEATLALPDIVRKFRFVFGAFRLHGLFDVLGQQADRRIPE